ncbi:MAG TPA: hypothetical protein VJX67_03300 [Blastocatellia bacterium]|nr:hypothetical protein [Blastocatellia bacterium]
MKMACLWLAVVAASALCPAKNIGREVVGTHSDQTGSQRRQVPDGIEFSIEVEKARFVLKEPIILRFHINNHSGQTLIVESPATSIGSNLEIDLRSGATQTRTPSVYEESESKARNTDAEYERIGSHFFKTIKSGEEWTDTLDLRRYYVLDLHVNYSIRATIRVKAVEGNDRRIVSNNAKFTIGG